jgi:outer membrane lipoprotein carrier protein
MVPFRNAVQRRHFLQSLVGLGSWRIGRLAANGQSYSGPMPDASRLLDGLLRRYGRLNALTATFVQVHQGRQIVREHGTLALQRPGRMRWDYAPPNVKQFLCDGKHLYFYSAARQHYTVEPVRASRDPRTPFLFLLGDRRIARLFSQVELAAVPPVRPGYVVLRLTPRERIERVTAVLVECHPKTFELARIALIGAAGEHDEFLLSEIVENPSLPDGFFTFAPPVGARRATP